MVYHVYSDVTGDGTGYFLAEHPTMETALEFAETAWTPTQGYSIHEHDGQDYENDRVMINRAPDQPQPNPFVGQVIAWEDLW